MDKKIRVEYLNEEKNNKIKELAKKIVIEKQLKEQISNEEWLSRKENARNYSQNRFSQNITA